MEPIKITDKVTLRQEALRMAIQIHETILMGSADIYGTAKKCADYIRMNAELPEYSDHDKFYTEILAKMQESFKPNPCSMWLPVDGDMKPPYDTFILGHENGSTHKCKYTDDGEYIIADGCVFHPSHWMPMPLPPFLNPTL